MSDGMPHLFSVVHTLGHANIVATLGFVRPGKGCKCLLTCCDHVNLQVDESKRKMYIVELKKSTRKLEETSRIHKILSDIKLEIVCQCGYCSNESYLPRS